MNRHVMLIAVLGSLAMLACLRVTSVADEPREPLARERAICGDPAIAGDSRILSPAMITQVQPLYDAHVTKLMPVPRVIGAKLRFQALPGMTQEWIARTLRCHQARVTAGHEAALANDPYWLPDSTVVISTESDGDGFLVSVRGLNPEAYKQVLERARAFVGR